MIKGFKYTSRLKRSRLQKRTVSNLRWDASATLLEASVGVLARGVVNYSPVITHP